MNPINCPTRALYEVNESCHSRIEFERSAFEHYRNSLANSGDNNWRKYEELFDKFGLNGNREKSPSFFLIWLRTKYPYEQKIQVASYKYIPQNDIILPYFEYILKGKKSTWVITVLADKQYYNYFSKIDFDYVNGKDIYAEYLNDIEYAKLDRIQEEYFLNKKTYLENCVIKK
jgi:hypothetical protein